jgi:hypothetical protein
MVSSQTLMTLERTKDAALFIGLADYYKDNISDISIAPVFDWAEDSKFISLRKTFMVVGKPEITELCKINLERDNVILRGKSSLFSRVAQSLDIKITTGVLISRVAHLDIKITTGVLNIEEFTLILEALDLEKTHWATEIKVPEDKLSKYLFLESWGNTPKSKTQPPPAMFYERLTEYASLEENVETIIRFAREEIEPEFIKEFSGIPNAFLDKMNI